MVRVSGVSTPSVPWVTVQEISGLGAYTSYARCSYRDGVEASPAKTWIILQRWSQFRQEPVTSKAQARQVTREFEVHAEIQAQS